MRSIRKVASLRDVNVLLAFHDAFSGSRLSGHAIDFILPTITKRFQDQFCRYVDGGAGVGVTALQYSRILESSLEGEAKAAASIVCYEPLVENFKEMSTRLATIPRLWRYQALTEPRDLPCPSGKRRKESAGGAEPHTTVLSTMERAPRQLWT